MELGGNAPFVVLDDADMATAVEAAMLAKMRNAGEACTAANRFYVHAAVADDFSQRLSAAMSGLRLGPGLDESSDVGPLINSSTRGKVAELVESAAGSARILTGGNVPEGKGYFYEPTVLTDVDPGAAILGEEIFGPVAPIVPFTDTEEAITQANDTEMGLISYVFSGDQRRAMDVAERLEAGMVAVNRGLISDPAAPFGGIKQSGIGREGAHHGMLEYLEAKYIGA
jgi:succinate-semialdehyde dehydrogenase/glutarate-semialdehyde dehydrogenase